MLSWHAHFWLVSTLTLVGRVYYSVSGMLNLSGNSRASEVGAVGTMGLFPLIQVTLFFTQFVKHDLNLQVLFNPALPLVYSTLGAIWGLMCQV